MLTQHVTVVGACIVLVDSLCSMVVRIKALQHTPSFVCQCCNLLQPTCVDHYWTVELAFPFKDLIHGTQHATAPPKPGDTWRINFSRCVYIRAYVRMHTYCMGTYVNNREMMQYGTSRCLWVYIRLVWSTYVVLPLCVVLLCVCTVCAWSCPSRFIQSWVESP